MFENTKKIIDRWVGREPINLHDGAINSLSYTFRVEADTITAKQKGIVQNVLNNYPVYWNEFEPLITKRFSVEDLNSRLLIYVPAVVGNTAYEFMLGYEFKVDLSLYSAFFAYNDGKLEYVHVDSY